jgi:hypothetical protein
MIHLTCGHTVSDFDQSHNIAIKAWDITEQGWVKCIHYLSVCNDCLEEYKQEDSILNNEYEESLWISHIPVEEKKELIKDLLGVKNDKL